MVLFCRTGRLAFALAVLAGTSVGVGAVASKEELKACKLPHGEVVIPLAGEAGAGKGDLFKAADASLASLPGAGGAKPLARTAVVGDVKKQDLGDLQFLADGGGTFWAVSGRIVEIGNRYLYEAAGMKLDRPALIPGTAGRPAGLLPEVREGRAYLLETADGHFALLRVLEIGKTSMTVQYVYQPSGLVSFEVPEGTMVDGGPAEAVTDPLTGEAVAVDGAKVKGQRSLGVIGASGAPGTLVLHIGGADKPAAPTVLEPYLETHLQQRELLIQSRLKTVRAAAVTPAEISRKITAIEELVKLRAGEEAAGTLVDQIAMINPKDEKDDFLESFFPCFGALKHMGKPASEAALKELRRMPPNRAADNLQDSATRARLLGLVVRAVEGDVVGEYMLRLERDGSTDAERRAMYDRILSGSK